MNLECRAHARLEIVGDWQVGQVCAHQTVRVEMQALIPSIFYMGYLNRYERDTEFGWIRTINHKSFPNVVIFVRLGKLVFRIDDMLDSVSRMKQLAGHVEIVLRHPFPVAR